MRPARDADSVELADALRELAERLDREALDPVDSIAALRAALDGRARFVIGRLSPTGDAVTVEAISLGSKRLARIEAAAGFTVIGTTIRSERWPLFEAVCVRGETRFVSDSLELAEPALPRFPKAIGRRVKGLLGLGRDTRAIHARLTSGSEPVGVLILWGPNLVPDDGPAVQSVADRLAPIVTGVATGTHRAVSSARHQARVHRLVADAGRALMACTEPEAVLEALHGPLAQLLDAERTAVFTRLEQGDVTCPSHQGMPPDYVRATCRLWRQLPMARLLDAPDAPTTDTVVVPDMAAAVPPAVRAELPETEIGAMAALPLNFHGQAIGVMCAFRSQPSNFGVAEMEAAKSLSHMVSAAYHTTELLGRERQRSARLEVLHGVASASTDAASEDALIERATEIIGSTLYPDNFGILLVDRDRIVPHPSYHGVSEAEIAISQPLGSGVAGEVAQTGEAMRLDDVTEAEDYRAVTEDVQSELCVPIRSGDHVIGVINAESRKLAAFTDADERLLATVAGQLATGIERARLFAALRESESRFRAVAESAVEAIVTWTADGQIVALNPAAERLFRLETSSAVGKPLDSLIAPTHRGVTRRYVRQMTSDRPRPRTEALRIRGLRADGTEFPLEVSVARWSAGGRLYLTGIGRDISRQVAAEEALARRADELQQVANLSAALRPVSTTADMVPEIAEHMALALNAVGATVLLANEDGGLTLRAVYPDVPEVVGLRLPPGEGLTAKVLGTGEPLIVHSLGDSEEAIVPPPLADRAAQSDSVVAVPLKTGDRCVGVMHVALADAADERHLRLLSALADVAANALNRAQAFETLEDRVLQRTRDLYEANARLLELDRLKSKFVSDVSHELRTPVSNLRLYLHLLEKGDPAKRNQYLQVLDSQTTRLANLIEDILDLGRLDLTAEGQHHHPTDVNDVVDAVRRESEARAKAKGLVLQCVLAKDLPQVRGDSNQLLQLAANLVTNAINYTPAGTVALETEADGDGVVLRVTDTGIGIGADDMPHLFDRFYRGTAVSQLDTPGTGLGLAIVQEIVELHGGRITVQSEVEEGTSFEVWLPRWDGDRHASAGTSEGTDEGRDPGHQLASTIRDNPGSAHEPHSVPNKEAY